MDAAALPDAAYASPQEIGRRIREVRQAQQEAIGGHGRRIRAEMADAAGVSERTIDNIEAGKASSQTHERLRAIALVLGVGFAELTEQHRRG